MVDCRRGQDHHVQAASRREDAGWDTVRYRIVLDRNADYAWAPPFYKNHGAPYLDGVVARVIPDESTRMIAFERGDLDVLPTAPPKEVRRLEQSGKYQVFQTPNNGGLYLGFNVTKPLLSDVRVRQAIGWAINRDEVVSYALEKLAVPMDSPLAPTIWGYWATGCATR